MSLSLNRRDQYFMYTLPKKVETIYRRKKKDFKDMKI